MKNKQRNFLQVSTTPFIYEPSDYLDIKTVANECSCISRIRTKSEIRNVWSLTDKKCLYRRINKCYKRKLIGSTPDIRLCLKKDLYNIYIELIKNCVTFYKLSVLIFNPLNASVALI